MEVVAKHSRAPCLPWPVSQRQDGGSGAADQVHGFRNIAAGAQSLDGLARQCGHSHGVAHTQQTGLAGGLVPPSLGGQVSASFA